MAVGTSNKSLLIKTISADSIATSVPLPMAIPISAWAKAGASFIPSPTMATNLFSSWSFLTSLDLSCGKTSAKTLSIPTWEAIALAVFSLSPVIIATSIPISWSFLIALALFSFTISATAIIPATFPSIAMYIGVLPSPASLSDSKSKFSIWIFLSFINFIFPSNTSLLSIITSIPWPGRAINLSTL